MAALVISLLITTLIPVTFALGHNYIPTYLFLTRVGPCTGEVTAVAVNEMTVTRQQYRFSVSGRLNVTRDITEGWMVRATIQKCQDIRNLDTCDHFKSFTAVENACTDDQVSDDEELYRSVSEVSSPRLACPVRAGVYNITDYPFVTRDNHLMVSESKISTSMFGYTFRLEGYSDAEKLMCIEAYLQLVYSNSPLNKGNGTKNNDSEEEDGARTIVDDDAVDYK